MIKDLITGDAAKEENKVLKIGIDNLKSQVSLLDMNVLDLKKQNTNLEAITIGQKQLMEIYKDDAAAAEKQLKKEKTKTRVYKVTTVLAVIGGFILAISN
ncbi:hypothetical protein [Flavobacterium beibuense]|uniref:hypothetical protein n=1 Tax=Flavobacterium beibuense TaxID=657326 RepID=UPI003A8EE26D